MLSGCEHALEACEQSESHKIDWDEKSSRGKTPTQSLTRYGSTYLINAEATDPNTVSGELELTIEPANSKVTYHTLSSSKHPDTCVDSLYGPARMILKGLDGLFDEAIYFTIKLNKLESEDEYASVVAIAPIKQWQGSWKPEIPSATHVYIILNWGDDNEVYGVVELVEEAGNSRNTLATVYNLTGAPKP